MSSIEDLDLVILKGITSNKEKAISFVHEFNDAKLFSPETWNFANQVISYIKNYKELPTLQVLCEKLKGKEVAIETTKKIWSRLESTEFLPQEFSFNLEKLQERYQQREIRKLQEELADLPPQKAVERMQATLQSIRNSAGTSTFENKSVREYLPTFVENFNSRKENPDFQQGIKTGYSFIDYATNGLREADYLLICGESGHGKSLVMQNIAIQVWMQEHKLTDTSFRGGKNIIYFSLEMPYEDCFNRLISRLSGVPSRSIESAKLTREESKKVKEALDFIKRYPYEFKIVDMEHARCNYLKKVIEEDHVKYDMLFSDYIGIMSPNNKTEEADWLKQNAVSQELRQIGRNKKIPVCSALQLNRKSDGKSAADQIGLHRLARSNSIATHCTCIIQLENRENENNYADISLHIIKNRRGPKTSGKLLRNLNCCAVLDNPTEMSNEAGMEDAQFTDLEDISEDMEDLDL